MLPDPVSGDVGRLIGAFHDPFQGFVVIPVKLGFIEALRPLLDERIVVIGLFEIQIILAVVWVRGNELATDGFMDFSQHRLDLGQQIICRIAAKIPNAGLVQAQGIAQFLRCGADWRMNIASGQPVDRQTVDDLQRHGFVGWPGK